MKNNNKKLVLGIIFIMILCTGVGTVFSMTKQLAAVEKKSKVTKKQKVFLSKFSDNKQLVDKEIVKSVDLFSLENKNEEEIKLNSEGDFLPNDSLIRVNWNLELKEKESKYNKGDLFEISIPEWIDIERDAEGIIELGTAEGTAKYYLSKSERKIRVELLKDIVSANYIVFTRANLKVKDDQKSILRELSFDTISGKQSYYLSVPFNTELGDPNIELPKGKMLFYDASGQENKKMPVKAKVENWVNQYQLDLKSNEIELYNSMQSNNSLLNRIILGSIKIDAKENKSNGEEWKALESVPKDKYEISEDGTGKVHIKFKEKFNKMLRITYDIEFNYDDYVPLVGVTQALFKTGIVLKENTLVKFPKITTKNFKEIEDYLKISSENARVYLKLKDVEINLLVAKVTFFVNLDEKELKKGSEFILETDDPENMYLNKILDAPINQASVQMTDDGDEVLGAYQKTQDWRVEATEGGKKVKIVYQGETTSKSLAVNIEVGCSAKEYIHINKFVMIGTDHLEKEQKTDYKITNDISKSAVNMLLNAKEDNEVTMSFYYFGSITNLGHITLDNFTVNLLPLEDGSETNYLEDVISADLKGTDREGNVINLVENKDYKVTISNKSKVVISFLKEDMNYQLAGKVVLRYDMSPFNLLPGTSQRVPFNAYIQERETGLKRYQTNLLNLEIRDEFYRNTPIGVSKHRNESYKESERYEERNGIGLPINDNFLMINPKAHKISGPTTVTLWGANTDPQNRIIFYHKKNEPLTVYKLNEVIKEYTLLYLEIQSRLKPIDKKMYTINQLSDNRAEVIINDSFDYPIIIKSNWRSTLPTVQSNFGKLHARVTNKGISQEVAPGLEMASSTRGMAVLSKDKTYPSVANLDLSVTEASRTGAKLIEGMLFEFEFPVDKPNELQILNGLIKIFDENDKEVPSHNIETSISAFSSYAMVYVRLRKDFKSDLKIKIPIHSKARQDVFLLGKGVINDRNKRGYADPAIVKVSKESVELIPDSTGGHGDFRLTNSVLTVRDKDTQKGIPDAVFELKDRVTGNTQLIGPSDSNGNIKLDNAFVSDYYLKQFDAPKGYDLNPDYSEGNGKEFRFSEDNTKNNFFVDLSPMTGIVIKFTYDDQTPILEKDIEEVYISHPKQSTLDLAAHPEIKKIKDKMADLSSDYRLIKFDPAGATGTENNLIITENIQTVYYKYEGLVSIKAPDKLVFETGQASPFKQELKTKLNQPFKLVLKDNRQQTMSSSIASFYTRGNFKIQARLSQPFEGLTPNNQLLNSKLLYFKGKQPFDLDGTGSEILQSVQDSAGPEKKTFEFILDDPSFTKKGDGFVLNVMPGEAKAQAYKGEMSFDFVQGP